MRSFYTIYRCSWTFYNVLHLATHAHKVHMTLLWAFSSYRDWALSASHSTARTYALELKHHIDTGLSSPDSLAALARTHTSFQRDGEQALYHTLYIQILPDVSWAPLEKMAANSEKATFVCSLMVERSVSAKDENWSATTYLAKALVNMRSLTDLRICLHPTSLKRMDK